MIEEFTVFVKCDTCGKEDDLDTRNIHCDDCIDKMAFDNVKEIIKDVINKCEWEDEDHFCDDEFENEEYKKCFFQGMRRGILDTLFDIADNYGDEGVSFFEKTAAKYWSARYKDETEKE